MSQTLHILNGDSTKSIFEQTGIAGDIFVWREVLSEGPVSPDFNSAEFWNQREEFMTAYFSLEEGEYQRDLMTPFQQMEEQLEDYSEVCLWFEYDLFCQINMIALIHWFEKKRLPGQTISLICSGKTEDSSDLKGLGEISPEAYQQLYSNRLKLNTREFEFASDVYAAYCSSSPQSLFTYTIIPSDEFVYLSEAISTHYRRFPYKGIGLNEIEQQMIFFIQEGVKEPRKLVGKMLTWQTIYGFGDLQYFKILERLKPLFENFEKLELNPNYKMISLTVDRDYMLGGAEVSQWEFDPETQDLISANL